MIKTVLIDEAQILEAIRAYVNKTLSNGEHVKLESLLIEVDEDNNVTAEMEIDGCL